MGTALSDFDDLTTAALRNLQKGNLAQMAQTMQFHVVMSKWFKKDSVEKKKTGWGWEHRVMNALPTTSEFIHIDEEDNPAVPRILDKITGTWAHHVDSYAWFEEEILACSGESEIVDLLSSRRDATKIKTAEVIENAAWTAPASTDTKSPKGIPYWLPADTSASTGRFATTLPSGYSDIAGLVPSAANNWTHWVANYTSASASDLIRSVRKSMDMTHFVSPVGKGEKYVMAGDNWQLFCGETLKLDIEDIATAQNENIGRDIAFYDGQTTIRGNPIMRVVPLDSATYTPLYGINHSVCKIFVLKGRFFDESGQIVMPGNHRGRVVYTDTAYNHAILNRRNCFVVHKTS